MKSEDALTAADVIGWLICLGAMIQVPVVWLGSLNMPISNVEAALSGQHLCGRLEGLHCLLIVSCRVSFVWQTDKLW